MYHILRFPGFKAKAITFSYDDGSINDRRLIKIFNDHGLKGTFNLNSSHFTNYNDDWVIHEDEALSLYAGHEIAVHGKEHLAWTHFPSELTVNDILEDRKYFERLTGKIINGMAYPCGGYNDDVVNIARYCGLKYGRTTVSTRDFAIPADWLRMPATCHHNDPELFALADKFNSYVAGECAWDGKPYLFYVWGHSHEFARENNWDRIEKFADAVSGKDDVWYATNGEIYNYVQAFKSLVWSVDRSTIYNPTATDVYLRLDRQNVLVPSGKTWAR